MLNGKLMNTIVMVVAFTVFAAATAFATPGCRNNKFTGSYTRNDGPVDLFGDGSVIHQYIYQLTMNSDGSVAVSFTGNPDFALNFGAGSTSIGSWACRQDGYLVVTFIDAVYLPVAPAPSHPLADLSLFVHRRGTLLFRVDDDNTLVRIQSRIRTYAAADDPTNAAGGTLHPLVTNPVTYRRLIASDADLLAP